MRTLRAKAAFIAATIIAVDGGFLLLLKLGARTELMVVILGTIMTAVGVAIAAFWEFPDEPPRWVQNQEARRKARKP